MKGRVSAGVEKGVEDGMEAGFFIMSSTLGGNPDP